MAARNLRHEFLAGTAKRLRIKTVALAHHADDRVELFFLRLLRGAGNEGLAGMGWKSLSPADPSIQLIRPLLDQPKSSLRDFAAAEGIPHREDASNALPDFQRNRIRNEVIPMLETIQPSLRETVSRTMEIAAWESNFVLGAAIEWLAARPPPPFDHLHIAVQRVCLRLQVRALGIEPEFDLIEQLRLHPNRPVSMDAKKSLYRDEPGTVHARPTAVSAFDEGEINLNLTEPGEVNFGGRKVGWSFQNKKGDAFRKGMNCEVLDANKVGSEISLRHWKPGDRFQPIGMKTPVKLQNLFTNLKIPRQKRHGLIVAITAKGELFWVEGLRISERFKLDKGSHRRLKWIWQCVGSSIAGAVNPC